MFPTSYYVLSFYVDNYPIVFCNYVKCTAMIYGIIALWLELVTSTRNERLIDQRYVHIYYAKKREKTGCEKKCHVNEKLQPPCKCITLIYRF